MVMVGGGEGAVDDTLETTSGDTVTLTCSLEKVENKSVTFTWVRQDGRPLPEGSTQANGERGGTIPVLREWRAFLASGSKLRSYQRAAENIFTHTCAVR